MRSVAHSPGFSPACWFDFEGNGTTLKTEVIAGLTTFATMAYMIAVVPGILNLWGSFSCFLWGGYAFMIRIQVIWINL